ncbi:hypothetical protein E6W39_36315 [Kitasatospora acidiphila]|uniref:Tetrapyrrole methylase domain-containing protein n=1 Tax=Kitasatospora acidiphila TaxID=2567942 RepID=A0A540WE28_9ACTN|nr:SAM-dependent methyltransferase [Kitasatospora acidiphila]TQF06664.1 hypothetical protein E6W39_36315 [Kitasatospora acidiphila]
MTITVVGIGYGSDTTAAVAEAIGAADVLIGHPVFLAAVDHLVRPGAECFDVLDQATPQEDVFAVRTRVAAERSAAGAQVVIVSGGDPGLLGMAGPALSNLERTGRADEIRAMRVLPGLSAWQYASAALGSPFNSGLAVLSLCLYGHTEEKITRQIAGVAASGLGIVGYMVRHNGEDHPELFPTDEPPAEISRRRFTLLRDELLKSRDPQTPAFLLTGLGGADGHQLATVPLKSALDLWEQAGPESIVCVPAEEYQQSSGLIWATT